MQTTTGSPSLIVLTFRKVEEIVSKTAEMESADGQIAQWLQRVSSKHEVMRSNRIWYRKTDVDVISPFTPSGACALVSRLFLNMFLCICIYACYCYIYYIYIYTYIYVYIYMYISISISISISIYIDIYI